ncbi:MAG: discoidin domain-containing protein, partial [Longicatena sp.]
MKKVIKLATATCLLVSFFTISSVMAQGEKIILRDDQISGYNNPEYPLKNIIDGDTTTYWKSVPQNGYGATEAQKLETRMNDHNRYINIKLDGVYDLDKITVYNNKNSANNYYIYASEDGTNFDKIVSKIDGSVATEGGKSFSVSKRASYIRLNMAYNSASYETNLAEIELFGTKVSEDVKKPAEIK